MRTTVLLGLAALFAVLLAGCSAVTVTQPRVTLPVDLRDRTFLGTPDAPVFVQQYVDAASGSDWSKYLGHITGYEGVSLTMAAVNATDDRLTPAAAHVRFYVSDEPNITFDTLGRATVLLDANLPAGERDLQYDSGMVPVSQEAQRIIEDGKFYLLATGEPSTINVAATGMRLHVKVRVSVL